MTGDGALDAAVRALDLGGLVVYPTDTLAAIGARADRPNAVDRLVAAKRRPKGAALSFAVSSYEELEPWANLTPIARAEIRRCLPGPVTVLLPASARARRTLAVDLIGVRGTVGIRIPDHPVARALARRTGPLVCTSANRHGEPPIRTIPEARRSFADAVAVYLPLRPKPSGVPSTLLDLTGGRPRAVERR